MLENGWSLPHNHVFELRDTPYAGRGIFARTDLTAGTHVLTTTSLLSPLAHVIQRHYRREVCAYCFRYDRGMDWKIRLPLTALSFCTQECVEDWKLENPETHVRALQAVEASIQRQQRQNVDAMDIDSENRITWGEAAKIGANIVQARSAVGVLSKQDRKLLAAHADAVVDPEILNFLLSGCFMAASLCEEKASSLLTLADNPSIYQNASLEAHVGAYLHLLTLLPAPLLPHFHANVCHELIARASHNAFSIRPSSDGEQSGEFLGYGIWPEASFFNHSCLPNLSKGLLGRLWSFRTTRNVKAGEELYITYLGGDERDFDVNGRRKRLLDEWGFVCKCSECKKEANEESDDTA